MLIDIKGMSPAHNILRDAMRRRFRKLRGYVKIDNKADVHANYKSHIKQFMHTGAFADSTIFTDRDDAFMSSVVAKL